MKFIKKLLYFNDLKLKHKLALIIIVVSTIICTFSIFSFTYTVQKYNDLLYSQTANSLSFFSDELTYQLEGFEDVSSYIAYDSTFQENLDAFNTSTFSSLVSQKARTDIVNLFNRYYTASMVNITVISNKEKAIWWGKGMVNESQDTLDSLYQACDDAGGRLVWITSKSNSDILCARKLLKSKNLSLKAMGYLIIQIDTEVIVDNLLKSRYRNGQHFQLFIHTKDSILYPPTQTENSKNLVALFSEGKNYAIHKIMGSRMFITYSHLPFDNVNWDISLAVPYDNMFHSLRMMIPMFILSLLSAVLLATALAGNIAKNISYQFHTLIGKMERIKSEGITQSIISYDLATNSQDELTVLNDYFDQMVIELKKLIEESYIKQLLITQAELKALEQQVNPHFLYNTLNSINWLAKKAGSKEISTIAESLGNMLRNTLNTGQTVIPLEQELEIVSCFVNIQRIRFEDLVVITEIDSSTLMAELPKMTIQPLIENAILYSQKEPQDVYLIHLSVENLGDTIKITIENSGSKMDVDILEHIKNQEVTPRGNGVGLVNIDSRLRILYGDRFHLHFDNINQMAVVWFEIPVNPHIIHRKEDLYV